jgi:hypothetical protein
MMSRAGSIEIHHDERSDDRKVRGVFGFGHEPRTAQDDRPGLVESTKM